jgi:hypothetical protein
LEVTLSELEFLTSSLGLQAALAGGYLGYVTAYAGLRRGHAQIDSAFISLAFGVPALLVFTLIEQSGIPASHSWVAASVAVVTSLVSGGIWRVVGTKCWRKLVSILKVHQDDGTSTAWDALIQRPELYVEQVSVHTKDGRTLFMNSLGPYEKLPHKGLILGGTGDIVMVVEEERIPGKPEDEERQGVITDAGLRMTYLPASEIARINLRIS